MLQRDEILQVHLLRVQKAHCERNLGVLAFFYVMLKAILCVQHFCSFGTILYIVNLLRTLILLLFVFVVCLSMFGMNENS